MSIVSQLLKAVLIAAATCAYGPTTASSQPAALDPAAPAVMLVFDGSGSMWGRLEGEKQAKFVTAREALKTAFTKLDPDRKSVV